METIIIEVKTEKPYKVYIGAGCAAEIENTIPDNAVKAAIIWDERVNASFVAEIGGYLEKAGIECLALSVEGGEGLKSLKQYEKLVGYLEEFGLTGSDLIVAVGGGTVGDLASFVASTYRRGTKLFMIPTTVLSACDSSVGGKNALNIGNYKNVVGTFFQPDAVFIDPETFDSLSDEVFCDGMAEIVKYGMICDEALFDILCHDSVISNRADYELLSKILARSLKIKAEIVERDETDKGERHLLNFGHTFAHAIESKSDFTVDHGRAVAMGMVMITKISEEKGLTQKGTLKKLKGCLDTQKIEWQCPYNEKALYKLILNDKKINGDSINLVIAEKPGKCMIHNVKLSDLEGWMIK